MAKLISRQSTLSGEVRIPGSKSHTIRAVLFAALAEGSSEIRRPLNSLDAQSAARCYRAFGASIDTSRADLWTVTGVGGRPNLPDDVLDVGNSGTTMNLALGTASLIPYGATVLTGDEQIRRRPSGPLVKSLNELGAEVISTRDNGVAPFVVQGALGGGSTEIEAASSQYLSSLLCCCPFAESDSEINVTLLHEQPYVEMTLWWLQRMGLTCRNENFKKFIVPGMQQLSGFSCDVPADFSTATFFLCAAAMAGKRVRITGLDFADTQGDKAVVDYLRAMGAKMDIADDGTVMLSRSALHGAELDLNATPDALPAMAVTACFAEGTTRLINVPQARAKETDRIAVMAAELRKLGAKTEELADGLVIHGGGVNGGTVDSHGDHRVVMSMAMAGMLTKNPVTILRSEAAAVTVPEFVSLMKSLGADFSEQS